MLVELAPEHLRVDRRRLRQERCAEARRERRLRLRDADLRTGELRREAGEEVVERLVAAQSRDRRQDPECIGGEHDHRTRMPGPLLRMRIRDLLELVRGTRVLRLGVVVEVESPALVDRDVLEDRPERVRRLEDLRLGVGGEADHLRVTAAFEVEDTGIAPAVLVVADQRALRVGRERRLSGSREPEEDRGAPVGRRRSRSSASAGCPRAAGGRSSR